MPTEVLWGPGFEGGYEPVALGALNRVDLADKRLLVTEVGAELSHRLERQRCLRRQKLADLSLGTHRKLRRKGSRRPAPARGDSRA